MAQREWLNKPLCACEKYFCIEGKNWCAKCAKDSILFISQEPSAFQFANVFTISYDGQITFSPESKGKNADTIAKEVITILETLTCPNPHYHQKQGAEKMLQVVKKWLNIEPIRKEIWEEFEK